MKPPLMLKKKDKNKLMLKTRESESKRRMKLLQLLRLLE